MPLAKSATENCHKSLESQRSYVSPVKIKTNLQDSDEDDLVIDEPQIVPISKKSKPFRGFKYQNVDERIQIMSPEERNLQISGTNEEEIDKTQVNKTTQVNDDSNKTLKSLMKTSLGIKSHINLCGVKNYISKMGSFSSEKTYISISEVYLMHFSVTNTE